MGNIYLGVNMEFVRHDDKPFEWGVTRRRNSATSTSSRWSIGAASCSARRAISTASRCSTIRSGSRGLREGGRQALGPLRPHAAVQAGDQRRIPEAGDPLRRRMRAPRWSTPTKAPSRPGRREERTHADALHPTGGGHGRRAPRHPDRPRAAPAVQQTPPTGWTDLLPGQVAGDRHQLRHRQQLPRRPMTLTAGSSTSRTAWSTCTPRTSRSSNPPPSAARSPARRSAAPAAMA